MRALALLPVLFAAPAAAQETFALPQGCEAYVTIQKRSCTVTHLFTCDGDPAGWRRRVDFDEQGLIYAGAIDAEAQWMESWSPRAGSTETLVPGAADPASFSDLLAGGIDTFDFATLETPGGFVTVFRGQDRLTGEQVVIDGVTLERTEFAVTAHDEAGAELWRTFGSEYIHRDWRSFIAGTRTTVTPEGTWDDDSTPVAFIFPGEAGFLSSTPRHDCGVMLSSVPAMPGAITPAAFHRTK